MVETKNHCPSLASTTDHLQLVKMMARLAQVQAIIIAVLLLFEPELAVYLLIVLFNVNK